MNEMIIKCSFCGKWEEGKEKHTIILSRELVEGATAVNDFMICRACDKLVRKAFKLLGQKETREAFVKLPFRELSDRIISNDQFKLITENEKTQ